MQCHNTKNFPIWKPLPLSIFPCFVICFISLDSSSTLSLIDRKNPLQGPTCAFFPLCSLFLGRKKRRRRESSISTQLELSFPFPSLDSLLSPFPLIQPQTKHEESITERDFTSSLNKNRPTAQLANFILKEGFDECDSLSDEILKYWGLSGGLTSNYSDLREFEVDRGSQLGERILDYRSVTAIVSSESL